MYCVMLPPYLAYPFGTLMNLILFSIEISSADKFATHFHSNNIFAVKFFSF